MAEPCVGVIQRSCSVLDPTD